MHRSLSSFLFLAVSCPLRYENGNESLENRSAEYIWHRLCPCLTNEKDIRLYEPCIQKIHSLAIDDGEMKFLMCWSTFWTNVTFKFPDIAVDYIDAFFSDAIDRRQTTMVALLNVSQLGLFFSHLDYPCLDFADTLSETSRKISCETG